MQREGEEICRGRKLNKQLNKFCCVVWDASLSLPLSFTISLLKTVLFISVTKIGFAILFGY